MRIRAVLVAALLVAAPSLAQEQEVRGEIFSQGSSASFDHTHVRGTNVNMSRLADGRWSGWLDGRFVEVTVDGNMLRGPNVSLGYERTEKETRVRGLLGTNTVSITVPNEPKGAAWHNFRLTGLAASEDPPVPQMVFALIAAL
jgi:hypothetical protein